MANAPKSITMIRDGRSKGTVSKTNRGKATAAEIEPAETYFDNTVIKTNTAKPQSA